jgi:hypothetical protein
MRPGFVAHDDISYNLISNITRMRRMKWEETDPEKNTDASKRSLCGREWLKKKMLED